MQPFTLEPFIWPMNFVLSLIMRNDRTPVFRFGEHFNVIKATTNKRLGIKLHLQIYPSHAMMTVSYCDMS